MGLALIVSDTRFRGAVFFRTFFFLPYMLSEVITGVLWQFIYHPQYGLVRIRLVALCAHRLGPCPHGKRLHGPVARSSSSLSGNTSACT